MIKQLRRFVDDVEEAHMQVTRYVSVPELVEEYTELTVAHGCRADKPDDFEDGDTSSLSNLCNTVPEERPQQ